MSRTLLAIFIIAAICFPVKAFATQEGDFGLSPQFGYTLFFGRLGEIVSPDLSYGADFQYGIKDWVAIDTDFLYSEHEQTVKDDYGEIQFNHLQTGLGPRFTYNTHYVALYGAVNMGANFYTWKNKVPGTDDSYDGNGMAGYITLGVDVYISTGATLGLAAKAGVCRSDFEFYTKIDGSESISAYGHFSPTLRLTMLF